MEIKIQNMVPINNGPLTAKGNKHLATFDADLLGFILSGCRLLHTASGNVIATPPEACGDRDVRRPVWIKDRHTVLAFSAAAREAYAALNGHAAMPTACPAIEESLAMAGM